jgi:NTP pyrophosphatase (non-canonical NTP hydrolase)
MTLMHEEFFLYKGDDVSDAGQEAGRRMDERVKRGEEPGYDEDYLAWYQTWAAGKWNDRGLNTALPRPVVELMLNATVGVAGEVGELTEIVKKLAFHNLDYTQELDDKIRKELGDIAYYWVTLCRLFGMHSVEVLETNVRKLNARYPAGFDEQRSNDRNEAEE